MSSDACLVEPRVGICFVQVICVTRATPPGPNAPWHLPAECLDAQQTNAHAIFPSRAPPAVTVPRPSRAPPARTAQATSLDLPARPVSRPTRGPTARLLTLAPAKPSREAGASAQPQKNAVPLALAPTPIHQPLEGGCVGASACQEPVKITLRDAANTLMQTTRSNTAVIAPTASTARRDPLIRAAKLPTYFVCLHSTVA